MKTTLITIVLFCIVNLSKAQTEIDPEVLNLNVLITHDNGSGSGFFFTDSIDMYLVTAKHVIFNLKGAKVNGEFPLKSTIARVQYYDSGSDTSTFNELTIDLEYYLKQNNLFYNSTDDVIAIHIMSKTSDVTVVFNQGVIKKPSNKLLNPRTINKEYIANFEDVKLGNDIFLFGYPKSLALQNSTDYNFDIPLLRKGTLAGKNIKDKKFVIDCPSYGGNSGGLVFNYTHGDTHLKVIGIVVSFIPFVEYWENRAFGIVNREVSNSGYSIVEPIDKVLDAIYSNGIIERRFN